MDSVVVDTDVVSFLFKQDTRALLYYPHLTGPILVVSFMTVAELQQWAIRRNWGATRQRRLSEYLQRFLVFHSDDETCRQWAEVTESARRNGRPIGTADAWIAATALLHGLPLLTHNRAHYLGVAGLTVVSEAVRS